MSIPFVSICIPVRNGETLLPHTLENVYKSNYPLDRFEVVVGNHGSEDNTVAILDSYKEKYSNLNVVYIEFTGPNRPLARNNIIKAAKGEILIFIDQDVLVSSEFINRHVYVHSIFPNCITAGYTFGKTGIHQLEMEDLDRMDLDNINNEYEMLKSKYAYKDIREIAEFVKCLYEYEEISYTVSPFRLFWSCNLSVRREDIIKVGMFDENFWEWGMEDDDLAYKFQLSGAKMVFSRDAWAFHIPHPVNTRKNLSTWRKNKRYLFKKFPNREMELFSFYKGEVKVGYYEAEFFINQLFPLDDSYENLINFASEKLKNRSASRLGVLMASEEHSMKLNLTHCFIPFKKSDTLSYISGNCAYWSLLGINTPFDDKSIDETILAVDSCMFLEDIFLKLFLTELARISKKVVLFYGILSKDKGYSYLQEYFEGLINVLNINEIERHFIGA